MSQYKTKDDLKIALSKLGFTDFVDKTQTKLIVNIPKGSDRATVLEEIAKKLKGKYNDSAHGDSSVGRTELSNGKWHVIAKIKGGGGSGAGSDLTKLTESAQCVYNACLYAGDTFTAANLKKHGSKTADVDEKMDNILKKLPDDWIVSSKIIAEKIKNEFPDRGKSYTHHRGSRWVDALEKHWKDLNKEAGSPFSNLNKWSPADIWLVSRKGSRVDIIGTKTLVELNQVLIDNLKSKDIVGVSLKKAVGRANYKELNVDSNRPTYKFESSTTGLRGFFQSGDGYMMFDGGKAQFRKFGSTWQGELKGKNANMGKVSGGPIITLLKMQFKKDMIPQRELMQRSDDDVRMFYDWYNNVPYHDKIDYFDFYKEVESKDMNWFISKAMTTQLISIVENLPKKKKDEFASALVNYAGSESVLSGPYVKVY